VSVSSGIGEGEKVGVGGRRVFVGELVDNGSWGRVGVDSEGPSVQAERMTNTKNRYEPFNLGIFFSLIGVSGYWRQCPIDCLLLFLIYPGFYDIV
jgi:hypothetical protein